MLGLVLLFLGALQVLLFAYGQVLVSNAARHGARAGSVVQSCAACAAVAAAQSAVQGAFLDAPTVEVLAPGGRTGATLSIRVSARVPALLPGAQGLGLEPLLQVSSEATFRQEGW